MTLTQYLIANNTPQRLELLLDSLETIGAYNLMEIIPAIEAELSSDVCEDNQIVMNNISNTILEYLAYIIKDHQIVLQKDANDLATFNAIAKVLYSAVQDYDPLYILDKVDCVPTLMYNAKNQFGDILKLLEGIAPEDYYETVESVPDSLMAILKDNLEAQIVTPPVSTNPEILERYKSFLNGRRTGVISELVTQMQIVGDKDPQVLLGLIFDLIIDLPLEERAFELVSLALISNAEDVNAAVTKLVYQLADNQMEEDELSDYVKRGFSSWK